MGGLTAEGTLDLLRTFGGAKHLCMLHAIMLQEVITTAGKFFKEGKGWKLVYGKQDGEFGGEAIAFRTAIATRSQTTVTNARCLHDPAHAHGGTLGDAERTRPPPRHHTSTPDPEGGHWH